MQDIPVRESKPGKYHLTQEDKEYTINEQVRDFA